MNKSMNVVLASDDNFVQHCSVLMLSVLRHNTDVKFFLLTEGLNDANASYLKELVCDNGGTLVIKKVEEDVVRRFPMPALASSHLSIATYYRLFVCSLLPEDVSKVIYLDCDMVVLSSLRELWDVDISGKALAAVFQNQEWSDYNMSWERLDIDRSNGYFNAGTLLINLDYLRSIKFEERAIQFIKLNTNKIISHDQDVLNSLLNNAVIPVSYKWNYLPLFMGDLSKLKFPARYISFVSRKEIPVIIHFASKPKPWNYGCHHPFKEEYYKYLQLTKWKNYTPKFNFKSLQTFIIRPFLIKVWTMIDLFKVTDKWKRKKIEKMINHG